jgi:hypothetical protein
MKNVLPLPVIETQAVQVDRVKEIALFLCLNKHHSMMSGGSSGPGRFTTGERVTDIN